MTEMKDLLQLNLDTPPVDRSVSFALFCFKCKSIRFGFVQLKPVRSLENFKSSPASPERWNLPPPRPSLPPLPSISSRFYTSNHRDTSNLLQSPLEDSFSPPARQSDLLDTTKSFIVGGGQNENGDSVFYLANRNTVDVVKLTPPASFSSTSRRKVGKQTQSLGFLVLFLLPAAWHQRRPNPIGFSVRLGRFRSTKIALVHFVLFNSFGQSINPDECPEPVVQFLLRESPYHGEWGAGRPL